MGVSFRSGAEKVSHGAASSGQFDCCLGYRIEPIAPDVLTAPFPLFFSVLYSRRRPWPDALPSFISGSLARAIWRKNSRARCVPALPLFKMAGSRVRAYNGQRVLNWETKRITCSKRFARACAYSAASSN